MRLERLRVAPGESPEAAARSLRPGAGGTGADPAGDAVRAAVAEIVDRVREGGDEAVLEYTQRFDTNGTQPWPLRVDPMELAEALGSMGSDLREALEMAAGNVRAVALASLVPDGEVTLPAGQRIVMRQMPVRRAAIYAPGGRAPYPSTVVMGVVTAQAAGVEQVVVCAPPEPDGHLHPAVAGACGLCGVDEVYRMGGAQAVAALVHGTETIEAVDVVVGPGNPYVQEAKRALADRVGIDGFAGPSELLVIIDEKADPRGCVLDLIAQAEHGADSLVVAVSPSAAMLEALMAGLEAQSPRYERAAAPCVLVEVSDLDAALRFSEAFAPEHLELVGEGAEALAPRVRSAGCLFVGQTGATAFGDYVAGSNHILPTAGAARFASALSPRHFRRRMAEVHVGEAAAAVLAPAGSVIARAEGFEAHADSMEARIGENGVGT